MADEQDEKKGAGKDPAEPQATVPEVEAPEVEAEVVEETDVETTREVAPADTPGDAPDDTADAGADPETASETTSETGPEPAPRKSTLTPGVIMFIAFAVLAISAVAFWRFQGAGQDEAETAGEPAATQEGEGAESAPPETPADAPPDAGGGDANEPSSSALADDLKIDNDAGSIKPGQDLMGPAPSVGNIPQTDDTFLPPLPEEGSVIDNQRQQDAAKEFMEQSEPGAQDPPAPEPASDPTTGGVEGFDIEGEDVSPTIGPESEPDIGAPGDLASAASGDGAAADKIDNADIEALKESFRLETQRLADALDEERARSAALGEAIIAMRRDFEAALAARDQNANAQMADLRARLEKIGANTDLTEAKRGVGAGVLSALKEKASAGEPFLAELDRLASLAPDLSELGTLRLYAETGAPTADALKEEFAAAAREGLAAAGREQAGQGFLAQLGARAGSVVSVRPAEPQAGDSPGAVISRAEAAALEGDFSAALAELETLSAAAQTAMEGWTGKARARADVDEAVEALGAIFLTPVEE